MAGKFVYHVACSWQDGEQYTQFYFDKKLNKKELSDYVHQATINALEYFIKYKEDKIGWSKPDHGPYIDELYPRIVKELVKLGFEKVKYTSSWEAYSVVGVLEKTGLTTNERLRKALPKDLVQRMQEISKRRYEERGEKREKRRKKKNL